MDNKELKQMRKNRRQMIWRRLKKNKTAMAGLVVIFLLIAMAVFANLIVDYDTQALAMSADRLQTPSAAHIFGTDSMGRDIFARIVYGARSSLSIGISITLLTVTLGVLLGSIAAYFGGKVDNIIMRILDVFICIPGILMALAIIAALGTSMINLIVAITVAAVPGCARMVRSVVLNVVGQDFVEAARANGMSDAKIIFHHIMPNAIGPIIVQGTMYIASMIISAASLSFIGMGIQPPAPEWGSMLSDACANMRNYPHLVIFPGLAIVLSALSFNLLGDGLRDALDPMLKD